MCILSNADTQSLFCKAVQTVAHLYPCEKQIYQLVHNVKVQLSLSSAVLYLVKDTNFPKLLLLVLLVPLLQ